VADADRIPPDPAGPGFLARAQAASDFVFELAAGGAFEATLLGYSILYGPRQVAPEEWCVVRRILDGRRQLVIADGGLKIQQRTYVDHAAGAVLLAVDQPAAIASRFLPIGEQPLYTIRQRIELICRLLGAQVELVDLPFELARPAHYLWGRSPAHAVVDDSAIRALGYRETIPAEEAMARTITWLVEHRTRHAAEWEEQIDDTFDYRGEDELIERWRRAKAEVASVQLETRVPAHRYRLPRTPGEPWRRPERNGGSREARNPEV
jgi:nucleoside-diphosphate-sugar epimerase